eukprot:39335_1
MASRFRSPHMDNNVISNTPSIAQNTEEEKTNDTTQSPLVTIPYPDKIVIHFRPVGSAPILKQKKFKVGADKLFLSLENFLKKQLKLSSNDQIYIYINQAFQPSFDERLGDLYSCFRIGKELVLHYSLVPAWS